MTTLSIQSQNSTAALASILTDPNYITSRGLSPAQLETWMLTNVTSFNTAAPVLAFLMQVCNYAISKQIPSL